MKITEKRRIERGIWIFFYNCSSFYHSRDNAKKARNLNVVAYLIDYG